MKKHLILICFAIASFHTSILAQNKESFEGLVKYEHTVIPHEKGYDVNYDYSGIGKNSDFYFKNGNYKWLTYDCYFKMDLFHSKEKRNYLLTKVSDTMMMLDDTKADSKILDYSIKKSADTILGYVCDELIIKLKPIDKDTPISYRRYFYSDKFYIDPEYFKGCVGNCYELIYSQIKSPALKIEFEWPNRTVVWKATKIEKMKLDDDFFKLDKKSPYKALNP